MNFLLRLPAVLAILLLGACTVSKATSDEEFRQAFPWYSPTPSDRLGNLLMWNDIDSKEFRNAFCSDQGPNEDSIYVLAISGSSVSLALDDTTGPTQTTTTINTPSKKGDLVGAEIQGDRPSSAPGKTVEERTVTRTNSNAIHVKRCELRTITAAVNLCIHRTASRNVLDKMENIGIDQVVAVAGTAAAVAALAHASGKQTTLAVSGAAGATALMTAMQKAVPAPTTAQISPVINAGLTYLLLDNDSVVDSKPPAGIRNQLLFDAAFSACPIST